MISDTVSRVSRRSILRHLVVLTAVPAASSLTFAQQRPAQPARQNIRNNDWPCFRGPNHDGTLNQNLTLLPTGPKVLWDERVNGGNASLAIVAGRLYTFGSRSVDNLVCLDATTGARIWKRSIETHYAAATPAVEGGRVYAQSSKDLIDDRSKRQIAIAYCCEAASGEVLWKRDLPYSAGDRQYGHAGSPRLWEDLVLHNAGGGAAVKKQSGEIAWAHEGFPGLATPVIFQYRNKPSVAFFGGDRLIARDARSGNQLFEIAWKTELAVNACDPIIFDNKLFICTNYGRGLALYDISAAQPRLLWETPKNSGASYSSGFVHQGNLYCFTSRAFARINLATGQPLWEDGGGGTATLIGDKLIRVRESGQLSIGPFSPDGFRATLHFDAGMKEIKAPPAYSAGRLYLRSEAGQVKCLQIGAV
jgi:outer membrane protein assembly factor BamB